MYDESKEPLLANGKLREVVDSAKKEADFLVKLLGDEQFAADESWARVQSCLLILRYSLAAKLIYFGQTIAPSVANEITESSKSEKQALKIVRFQRR